MGAPVPWSVVILFALQPNACLRHQPVVVLNTAEDGESHQPSGGRRRFSEFRVRVWYAMDGLRRPPTIVVANVLGSDTADVINVEEDEVVQRFLSQRPIEPLDVRRCIRSAKRNGEPFNAHRLVKPAVQVAAIAAPLAVSLCCGSLTVLAKDAVIVVDEEAGPGVSGRGFADLLLHPEERRVGCDVHMDDPSRVDLHDDEDIRDGEEGKVRQVWSPRGVVRRGSMYRRIVLVECSIPNLAASSSAILSSPHSG